MALFGDENAFVRYDNNSLIARRPRLIHVQIGDARTRRSQIMSNLLDLLNKFIGAIIAYGPKNKTKKARMARKAARRKKLAAMKRN
jgi:hypothetical protein